MKPKERFSSTLSLTYDTVVEGITLSHTKTGEIATTPEYLSPPTLH
jgi:hypothetical protein